MAEQHAPDASQDHHAKAGDEKDNADAHQENHGEEKSLSEGGRWDGRRARGKDQDVVQGDVRREETGHNTRASR